MKKNEIYVLTIDDMGSDGEGIGHIPVKDGGDGRSFAVFVKDAVVGDVARIRLVKVKKSYAYGKIEELLTPSANRVIPDCDISVQCGGCSLMHMSYEAQLDYKKNKVVNCLARIGGIPDVEAKVTNVYGMERPYRYRNKMQFPVGLSKEGKIQIGFYAPRSHRIIDLTDCKIGHPVHMPLLAELRVWLEYWQERTGSFVYNEELHQGLVRHIVTRIGYTTGEMMVCVVINGKNLPDKECVASLMEALHRGIQQANDASVHLASVVLNSNMEKTNRILGDACKTIYGKDYIEDYIGKVKYQISALSFYQVNPIQTRVLYDKVAEYAALTGEEIVWDLYCGIGTISLYLADRAKEIHGVEIVPQAIEDARRNAEINGITKAQYRVGKAEDVAPQLLERGTPDVIVVDPPRKGCDATLLDTIVMAAPERLVYVSCDPATLARDLAVLGEKGYELCEVSVVDQFCHSGHVETVVLLSREKVDGYINIDLVIKETDY